MKVRTSAGVASVVPSLNTIVRVSLADQPLPEMFAIRDSPSAAHLVPLALAERICLTFDRVDPARVHGSFDRFQTPYEKIREVIENSRAQNADKCHGRPGLCISNADAPEFQYPRQLR
jgi:hypothetical protein